MNESETILACPFCGSDGILRKQLTGHTHYHCAGCGADVMLPSTSGFNADKLWNRRAGGNGASSDNRGKRFAPASWLDALAQSLERRAKGLEKMSRIDCAEGQIAKTCKIAYEEIAEMIRADVISASNVAGKPPTKNP